MNLWSVSFKIRHFFFAINTYLGLLCVKKYMYDDALIHSTCPPTLCIHCIDVGLQCVWVM